MTNKKRKNMKRKHIHENKSQTKGRDAPVNFKNVTPQKQFKSLLQIYKNDMIAINNKKNKFAFSPDQIQYKIASVMIK